MKLFKRTIAGLGVGSCVLALGVVGPSGPSGATSPLEAGCSGAVDDAGFASADRLLALTRKLHSFGELRLPGSPEHRAELAWLEDEFRTMPGVRVASQDYRMTRWLPTGRNASGARSLAASGRLAVLGANGKEARLRVPAVQAFSRPTSPGVVAPVVYLAPGEEPTPAKVKGKIVLQDLPISAIPFAALTALSYTVTPDLLADSAGQYARSWLTAGGDLDTTAAAQAGAVGFIEAFNVPARDVRGYFSTHTGTLQHIPSVWVGVDERERLKRVAERDGLIRLGVKASVTPDVPTRNVIATLPGQSSERIVLAANTDGSGWVQENSLVPLLELMRYWSSVPAECRDRTIQIVFGSAHLGYAWDGVDYWVNTQIDSGEAESIAFGFAVEHMGARQIDVIDRAQGPGQDFVLSDKTEPYAWFAPTESPVMAAALSSAVHLRNSTRTSVLRGIDPPTEPRLPLFCNFGGLANSFHGHNIPSMGGISGPETLWGPGSFGIDALDFDHMRRQALVVGDTVMTLQGEPREAFSAGYAVEDPVNNGPVSDCSYSLPPKVAPR